jgi:ABC-type sulfate transport system permease component
VLLRLTVSLGTVFALPASAMAFLISWHEYSRHFRGRMKAMRLAIRTAVVAFLFFAAIALLAALVIARIIFPRE